MLGKTTLVLAFVLVVVSRAAIEAQDQEPLQYSVVLSDSRQLRQFRDEHLPRQTGSISQTQVTPFADAEKVGFLHLPQGL